MNEDEVTKRQARMIRKTEQAWRRWRPEYLHGLMEHHRVRREENAVPDVVEIVLLVGEEKNRAEW